MAKLGLGNNSLQVRKWLVRSIVSLAKFIYVMLLVYKNYLIICLLRNFRTLKAVIACSGGTVQNGGAVLKQQD